MDYETIETIKINSEHVELFKEALDDLSFTIHEIGHLSDEDMKRQYPEHVKIWHDTISNKLSPHYNNTWVPFMKHIGSYTTPLGDIVGFEIHRGQYILDTAVFINGRKWNQD